eukprot:1892963-Pleurochrysis_carterae.AAC.1
MGKWVEKPRGSNGRWPNKSAIAVSQVKQDVWRAFQRPLLDAQRERRAAEFAGEAPPLAVTSRVDHLAEELAGAWAGKGGVSHG